MQRAEQPGWALRFLIPATVRGATLAHLALRVTAKNQRTPVDYAYSQIIGYRGRVLAVEDNWNATTWSMPLLTGWDYQVKKVTPAEALKLPAPQPFDLVYWECDSNSRPLNTPEIRTWLRAWRGQGGKLLLTGSRLGATLLKADPAFLREVLGVKEVYSAGDCNGVRRLVQAVYEGARVGRDL